MSYMRALASTIGSNAGCTVTSRTLSPSIQISRPSRKAARYCSPVRIIYLSGSSGVAGENRLLQDRMNAPVGVHYLCHSEINGDRHQRNRIVLGQPPRRHKEMPHLPKRVRDREVERGCGENLPLRCVAEFRHIVGETKAVNDPFVG